MIRKSTWILFALFLFILAIGIYLNSSKGILNQEKTPTPVIAEKALPEISLDKLVGISYIKPQSNLISLTKNTNGVWVFVSNPEMTINQARLLELISNLNSLEVMTKMNSTSKVEELGLLKNAQEINIIESDGSKIQVKIGNLTPTESGYYLQVENANPVIVGKGGLETILGLLTQENLLENQPISP